MLKTIFHALRYRNFRIFFIGQGVSLVGTWMQFVAMSWLVYRITNSPFLLGLVGFSSQIPAFILTPFAGVMADRWNRHRVLIVTQSLSMVQAVILAILVLKGNIAVWQIIALGIFLGCIGSLDIPVRQSFLVDMVEKKENLGNAIALNSLMFNSARLIGPCVAGLVISNLGEGACFLINALSFIAVIASLLMMKIKPRKIEFKNSHLWETMKEGFSYVFSFLPIRLILLILSIVSLMGSFYVVLMPVFAKDILGGGAATLGFLMAASGIGALAATVYLASRKSIVGLGTMIPISSFIFAVGIILFSLSRSFLISLSLLAIIGFGIMVNMAACNTILQTIADDDKMGRVMSFYTMAFLGTAPIGSLLGGWLASTIGATNTLVMGGAFCILASAAFAAKLPLIKKIVHPIYKRIGIIPEVASGISAVAELTVPPED